MSATAAALLIPVTKPLVFKHGAAETAFGVALAAWAVFEFVMTVRQTWRLGRRPARDPSGWVLGACIGGSIVAALRLGGTDPLPWPGGRLWPVIVGLTLVVAGIGARAWSIATLGRFFQYRIEVQADHQLITAGPYRYVRHPSYTGLALVLVGMALATGDVLSLVATAVLAGVGLAVRIRAEERQLIEALGAQYERLAAERTRLVPRIW
jgi:protein-S-isoprenylcysteine O-methyltransferase Ste14